MMGWEVKASHEDMMWTTVISRRRQVPPTNTAGARNATRTAQDRAGTVSISASYPESGTYGAGLFFIGLLQPLDPGVSNKPCHAMKQVWDQDMDQYLGSYGESWLTLTTQVYSRLCMTGNKHLKQGLNDNKGNVHSLTHCPG